MKLAFAVLALSALAASSVAAQQAGPDSSCAAVDHAAMNHAAHAMPMTGCTALPTRSPQAAYGTLQEVVRLLKADPTTNWSTVNLEALRQHLIDMDDVILRAAVVQHAVPGGIAMTITGTGRTALAIKRMVTSHAMMLGFDSPYAAAAAPLPNGVRLTVTARDRSDTATVAMIRGLGFAGLITEGDHHAMHHMALARGDASMQPH